MSIRNKIRSDRGALNSTEIIMLIALSVFLVLAITRYIINPLIDTSKGIGEEIKEMNPR